MLEYYTFSNGCIYWSRCYTGVGVYCRAYIGSSEGFWYNRLGGLKSEFLVVTKFVVSGSLTVDRKSISHWFSHGTRTLE